MRLGSGECPFLDFAAQRDQIWEKRYGHETHIPCGAADGKRFPGKKSESTSAALRGPLCPFARCGMRRFSRLWGAARAIRRFGGGGRESGKSGANRLRAIQAGLWRRFGLAAAVGANRLRRRKFVWPVSARIGCESGAGGVWRRSPAASAQGAPEGPLEAPSGALRAPPPEARIPVPGGWT